MKSSARGTLPRLPTGPGEPRTVGAREGVCSAIPLNPIIRIRNVRDGAADGEGIRHL